MKKRRHAVPKATAITICELKLSHHMQQSQRTREDAVIDILKLLFSASFTFGSI